jgi:hypothetical protein
MKRNKTDKKPQAENKLTPCSKSLAKNLTGPTLLKKFPEFYGTRRFIAAFTTACPLSLSWARSIQSCAPIQPLEDPF